MIKLNNSRNMIESNIFFPHNKFINKLGINNNLKNCLFLIVQLDLQVQEEVVFNFWISRWCYIMWFRLNDEDDDDDDDDNDDEDDDDNDDDDDFLHQLLH